MSVRILIGDVLDKLRALPSDHFDVIITSPPYWGLRDYGVAGQLGLEATLGEHLDAMVEVFRECRRVLKATGTLWLNYGDCYATTPNGRSAAATKAAGEDDRTFRDKPFSTVGGTLKPKDLCMIPNRLAIALQDDGWWVRSENIWGKTNPMPESTRDRPATAFEKVFQLTKSGRYFYNKAAVRQGRTSDENANGFRGGSYVHDVPSGRAAVGNYPVPKGWDQSVGEGGHGTIHRTGRERGDSFARHHKASAGDHGQSSQFRTEREPVAYLRGEGRSLRTYEPSAVDVWAMATTPFDSELCTDCCAYFDRKAVRALRVTEVVREDGGVGRLRYCSCGSHTGWLSHFATFPPSLVERCLDASGGEGARVLDPFGGAGTTGLVAARRGLDATVIELNPWYALLAMHRIGAALPDCDIVMGDA
nr:site-specific DNA-methyltransferase [uncultured Brevundimonas sp.]